MVRFLLGIFAAGAILAQTPQTSSSATIRQSKGLMSADRAKATFDDLRVVTFLRMVSENFGGGCVRPPCDHIEAKMTSNGAGDFSSTYYEFTIPCGDQLHGVTSVGITVEFSPPMSSPLNLTLSVTMKT